MVAKSPYWLSKKEKEEKSERGREGKSFPAHSFPDSSREGGKEGGKEGRREGGKGGRRTSSNSSTFLLRAFTSAPILPTAAKRIHPSSSSKRVPLAAEDGRCEGGWEEQDEEEESCCTRRLLAARSRA